MHLLRKGDKEGHGDDVRVQDRHNQLLLLEQVLQIEHNHEKEDKQEGIKAEEVKPSQIRLFLHMATANNLPFD
jgi:hypothetical protein